MLLEVTAGLLLIASAVMLRRLVRFFSKKAPKARQALPVKNNRPPVFTELEPDCPPRWYQKAGGLLTPTEQIFLNTLDEAIAPLSNIRLYAKPRIADVVRVVPGLEKSDYMAALRKIAAKHVDFVLVEKRSSLPLLVIELDDYTHNQQPRQLRDAFVDEVMQQADLPILHVPVANQYNAQILREYIVNILRKYYIKGA